MESGARQNQENSIFSYRTSGFNTVSAAIFDSEQQEARPVSALMQRVRVSNRSVTRKSVSSVWASRNPSQASNISARQGLLTLLYTNSRKMHEVKKS